jgi:hypothetical protein
MLDPNTGERRPKKRPGRQKVTAPPAPPPFSAPDVDALKAAGTPIEREQDRSPDATRRPRGKRARARERPGVKKETTSVPPFRQGPIAAGVNKIYARVGKIVKAMDRDIGVAIISTTRKESDDDSTVGEAWEELARVNPRVRAFLLKAIEGGTLGALFWAHAPIFLAVLMKEGIRNRLPFGRLLGVMLEPDDGDQDAGGMADLLGGLQGVDVGQMMGMAAGLMDQMAANVPRSAGAAGAGPRVGDPEPVWDGPVVESPPDAA